MIILQNVSKKFGELVAVDNLNLTIFPGEFFAFLCPNGAGKTKTIKMIAGLYTPTSGKISIDKYDIQKNLIEAKHLIGYISDKPFLYDKLTGLEYLYFSDGLYRIEKRILKKRINELIERLELGDWINKITEEYSRGMRKESQLPQRSCIIQK